MALSAAVSARGKIYKLDVDRGERFVLRVTVTETDGSVVDLTGHTVELIIGAGGVEILKTTNTAHTDATSGITDFEVTSTITLMASATADTTWYFAVHWKDNSTPAREDIHSSGTIRVHAVPVSAIA